MWRTGLDGITSAMEAIRESDPRKRAKHPETALLPDAEE